MKKILPSELMFEALMSALGQKRTFRDAESHVRFTPESGHSAVQLEMSALGRSGHRGLLLTCKEKRR